MALCLDNPSTPTPDSLLAPGRLPPVATFLLCLSDSFKFTCQHNLESNSRSRGLMKAKCAIAHNPHRQNLGHSSVILSLMPLLFMQKGKQWGRRRNQAVALAVLSLNFSGKASRGVVREISQDAGL